MKENQELRRFISFRITTKKGGERIVKASADAQPAVLEQYSGRITGEILEWAEDEHGKKMYSSPPQPQPKRK